MATKRETKKRIGTQYRKLQEDIARYSAICKGESAKIAKKLNNETIEARHKFGCEINEAIDSSKNFYKELTLRVVNDLDEKYNQLKDMIAKK